MLKHKYELLPGGASAGGERRVHTRQRQLFAMMAFGSIVMILGFGFAFQEWLWQSAPTPQEEAKLGDWVATDGLGRKLYELGPKADESYHIGFIEGYEGTTEFFVNLWQFTATLIPESLRAQLQAGIQARLPHTHAAMYQAPSGAVSEAALAPMRDFKTIFQTDKNETMSGARWVEENPGWTLDFYDDADADRFVRDTFPAAEPPKDKNGHEVEDVAWAWGALKRGVLKADLLRYLLPLVKGGVYVDTDTTPTAPIAEWGQSEAEWFNVNRTDGPGWREKFGQHDAAIVLGIDVDVHADLNWHRMWPRPLGVCQWALASAPAHPIMLEAVRRVVRNTAYVRAMREYEDSKKALEDVEKSFRAAKARLEEEGRTALQLDRPLVQHESQPEENFAPLSVINWTGPGVFTDAVMAYLLARYRVSWKDLRGLTRPTRIGEVLILPITAFSPGGHKDFGAGRAGSPQNALVHNFKGSWKAEGW